MAILVWLGTFADAIGEWSEGHNWLDEDGADAGVVPTTGDDVYFTSGSQDVQADTITPSVVLDSLNFGTRWTGSFVTEVDPTTGTTDDDTLDVGVMSATVLEYAKKIGAVELTGTYTTANVQATSVDSPALLFNSSTIPTLNITGGNGTIFVDRNTTLSGTVSMVGAKKARLELEVDATVNGVEVTMDAGRFITYNEIDKLFMYGGVVEFRNATGTTNLIDLYQGTIKYKPTGGAVLSALNAYGGFFDMRGCPSPSHTITAVTMYAGSMIDERNGLSNTTYTDPIVAGGIIKCDLGRTVTVV